MLPLDPSEDHIHSTLERGWRVAKPKGHANEAIRPEVGRERCLISIPGIDFATIGERTKRAQLTKKLEQAQEHTGQGFTPNWRFSPLGFDSFGAMGDNTKKELKQLVPLMARRLHSTESHAAQVAYNAISYAIWTSAAVSIISRQPTHSVSQWSPTSATLTRI